jgi:hypothetical protein
LTTVISSFGYLGAFWAGYFTGELTKISLYSRVLSDAERLALDVTGTLPTTGCLFASDEAQVGNGLVWHDVSGNASHVVIPTGMSWTQPSNGDNYISGQTATSGNQELLGAATIKANTVLRDIYARSVSGTPSITLGTTNGGNEIVASVALSTTWKKLTIALTGGIVSANSSVFVGSSTADPVQVKILTSPLNP